MKKKRNALAVLTAVILTLGACSGAQPAPPEAGGPDADPTTSQPPAGRQQVYFTTGTPGGVYEILGTGMANVINRHATDIEVVAVTPAQMQQAPGMMQSGESMLSIGMACMFERAYNGQEEFSGSAMPDLMQVAGMYDNVFAYVARADSALEYVEDITEKTVIASTATNRASMAQLIDACGTFDSSDMDYRVMSYAQASEALSDGNAEVAPLTAFPYSGTVDSLVSTKGVKFLKVRDETRARFDETQPRKQMREVPANTYAGQTEPVWAYTTFSVLYASKNLSEDIVYEITRTLIENVDDLALVHATGAYFTDGMTAEYLESGVMEIERMHPGAIRYFKEAGILR